MRIARLDLLNYGKFTDRSVTFPQARRDFHLIVGPNEAGKSTLRSAILDLLFGIETRSPYNFLHAYSDMRLGALVEHDGAVLDFVRIKARSKTLQSLSGATLADNELASLLGSVDRSFFDQMFGLDHERLVKGGREILTASNDVGRILFQSAAGIGSLGEVREALETEANSLWAKRRSGDREYYAASDELEQADVALKQATVRTKDWVEARTRVEKLEDELNEARKQYRHLEQERTRLDRIRRVAPLLTTLQSRERELAELGVVIHLPPEAGKQLEHAERVMVQSNHELKVFKTQAEKLKGDVGEIHPDAAVLARQADIQALSEQRQQLRNHPSDIGKRQEEVKAHWKAIEGLAHQLGWSIEGEEAIEERIPSQLVRSAMAMLIRRHDVVMQALEAAQEVQASKQSEIRAIDTELQTLPMTESPVALQEALAAARSLGDVAAQVRRLASQLDRSQRELEAVTQQLGSWQFDIDSLRRLQLPTQEEVSALQNRQTDLEISATSLAERMAEQQSRLNSLELEISQYKAAHHPVSIGELTKVRGQRDLLWQSIKTGEIELTKAVPDYEARVAGADTLSDKRHDKAQEATELQAKLDQREHLNLQLAELMTSQNKTAQAKANLAEEWVARTTAIGLAGMEISQINAWRTARDQVFHAAEAVVDAQHIFEEFRDVASCATSALGTELGRVSEGTEQLSLSALVLRANDFVDAANRAQERRGALTTQKARAEIALTDSTNKLTQAQAKLDSWRIDWEKHLASAHLDASMDTGTVEGALTLFDQIDERLRQIRELRTSRIDAMQRDLDDFAAKASELAQAVAPELLEQPAELVARLLGQRLAETIDSNKELERLKTELDSALNQLGMAEAHIQETQAQLAPLLHLAGVESNDELRSAIDRSDLARNLDADIRGELQALQESGDGLLRNVLEAEFAASDLAKIPAELTELKYQVEAILEQQNRIAAELNSAKEALAKIAGQDEAARAESKRQEALARMANAAERYIKVYTGARLLRWAIERYRETKQGPMLSRAGEIFSSLTLGSFVRLVVDYDSDPLTLYGQRKTGEHVAIEGMSDGTRDQLYLALRLAALELHLQQASAMPFIADDLVINYDDGRARASLEALTRLSEMTQVIFLSHHDHLVPVAESVFGPNLNVIRIG